MTTLNNDELREQILGISIGIYVPPATVANENVTLYIQLEPLMQLFATHDQQLLEAILAGAVDSYDGADSSASMYEAVPVEHIKSVFEKEGE